MDEDNTVPAENIETVEDNSPDTSPVHETNTSDSPETVNEPSSAEETPEETNNEPERKPTRAERRIRQLAEQNKQLRSQPNQFAPSLPQPPQLDVQPGQELSVEEYQKHVAQAAQSVVNPQLEALRAEMETKEALRNFDADLAVIENKYPELAEDSPIAEVLENKITEKYQKEAYRLVGFDPVTGQPQYRIDPSVRLSEIAAKEVADARAIAERASADMRNAVAKQADDTAIRPNANTIAEKSPKDMSIAELEAKLGFHRE